jgi:methyl-accepting chemotaxis protein
MQSVAEQRQSLIRSISLIIGIGTALASLFYSLLALLLNWSDPLWLIPGVLAIFASALLAFVLNRSITLSLVAGWVLIIGHYLFISLSILALGSLGPVSFSFLWLVLLAGLLRLGSKAIVGILIYTSVHWVTLILADYLFNFYSPLVNMSNQSFFILSWAFSGITHLWVVGAGVVVFVNTINKANQLLEANNQKLNETNYQLAGLVEVTAEIARQTTASAIEANTAAIQHASGTKEQASALKQIAASLSELSATANQIAENASRVYSTADSNLRMADDVKEAAEEAKAVAEDGREAVNQLNNSINRVSGFIESLAQKTLHLTAQAKQIETVMSVMRGISDETHLLALNAQIEAAGSSTVNNRFGVVAQEVKALADRSREATEEVKSILSEIQASVASLVLTAEETRKENRLSVTQAFSSGTVIEKLYLGVIQSVAKALQFVEVTEQMKQKCEEIQFSTHQQQSAGEQIALIAKEVSVAAQQNASTLNQVVASFKVIEEKVLQVSENLKAAA